MYFEMGAPDLEVSILAVMVTAWFVLSGSALNRAGERSIRPTRSQDQSIPEYTDMMRSHTTPINRFIPIESFDGSRAQLLPAANKAATSAEISSDSLEFPVEAEQIGQNIDLAAQRTQILINQVEPYFPSASRRHTKRKQLAIR